MSSREQYDAAQAIDFYRVLAHKRGGKLMIAAIRQSNLTTALFGMARRAAYWRWAYRDVKEWGRGHEWRHGVWKERALAHEADNAMLQRALASINKSLGYWFERASDAGADSHRFRELAYRFHDALWDIAKRDCLNFYPGTCVGRDVTYADRCPPCIARHALGWSP